MQGKTSSSSPPTRLFAPINIHQLHVELAYPTNGREKGAGYTTQRGQDDSSDCKDEARQSKRQQRGESDVTYLLPCFRT